MFTREIHLIVSVILFSSIYLLGETWENNYGWIYDESIYSMKVTSNKEYIIVGNFFPLSSLTLNLAFIFPLFESAFTLYSPSPFILGKSSLIS